MLLKKLFLVFPVHCSGASLFPACIDSVSFFEIHFRCKHSVNLTVLLNVIKAFPYADCKTCKICSAESRCFNVLRSVNVAPYHIRLNLHQQIIKMRTNGKSPAVIAKELGISKLNVYDHLKFEREQEAK